MRRLGIPPTYDFADPRWGLREHTVELAQQYADAFLWIGRPWLYDQNEPFVESRALTLAASAAGSAGPAPGPQALTDAPPPTGRGLVASLESSRRTSSSTTRAPAST